MTERTEKNSFWSTLPGILAGFAGLITAIGGLLLALNQTGILGENGASQEKTTVEQPVYSGDLGTEENRRDILSSICPVGFKGCTKNNLCSSCFQTCGFCQNLNQASCGVDDCMTCKEGYQLVQIYSDGTGRCVLK